jgi:magnesium chelatase family protein
MFFKLDSFTLMGIDAVKVSVEIHISRGLPDFIIVGLPGKAVNESRQRVRSAIINSGFDFPVKKIILNLSPADIKKDGSFYDLPIALSILAASCQIRCSFFKECCFIGELSLDGNINPVKGLISMAEKAHALGKKYFFVPSGIARQASFISGVNIVACKDLGETIKALSDEKQIIRFICRDKSITYKNNTSSPDFKDVKGQLKAKRALEIAVSGRHNIMLIGPPGSGKTMLARRAVSIMPVLSLEECIEVTKIYSLYEKSVDHLIWQRPFRNPHHTASRTGLVGGGVNPRPGEISLAHRGVLFLDEFSQFSKNLIEDLRQPLENKSVVITRNHMSYSFPCNFMMIAAVNPCYCGYFGDESGRCVCSPGEVRKFWKKMSGPVMDRIDMRVTVSRLPEGDFIKPDFSESSYEIRKRVTRSLEIQGERFKGMDINYNSEIKTDTLSKWMKDNRKIRELIYTISKRYRLTARGTVSILKVSRTIADLEESRSIKENHIAEAVHYRVGSSFNQEGIISI